MGDFIYGSGRFGRVVVWRREFVMKEYGDSFDWSMVFCNIRDFWIIMGFRVGDEILCVFWLLLYFLFIGDLFLFLDFFCFWFIYWFWFFEWCFCWLVWFFGFLFLFLCLFFIFIILFLDSCIFSLDFCRVVLFNFLIVFFVCFGLKNVIKVYFLERGFFVIYIVLINLNCLNSFFKWYFFMFFVKFLMYILVIDLIIFFFWFMLKEIV